MFLFENRFTHRVLHKALWALLLPLCALWGVVQSLQVTPAAAADPTSMELPLHWQGSTWRPQALSEVEQRFAQHFPGHIARLTDGQQVLVLRQVREPTRQLHPAADCYRGLGYRISQEQLQARHAEPPWRCFVATRQHQSLRVCERIEDTQGHTYTDTSAWYWAAVLGQSSGPWQATTVASPVSG